jgi:hypothetical protein
VFLKDTASKNSGWVFVTLTKQVASHLKEVGKDSGMNEFLNRSKVPGLVVLPKCYQNSNQDRRIFDISGPRKG